MSDDFHNDGEWTPDSPSDEEIQRRAKQSGREMECIDDEDSMRVAREVIELWRAARVESAPSPDAPN